MSKNKHFDELAKLVQDRFEIDQEQLIDALFIIRAHYNLAGIVTICTRLNELIEVFPKLHDGVLIEGLEKRLSTLETIANFIDAPGHFIDESINKNKINATPLRPHTGDSSLCDLLLIQPQSTESGHLNLFDWVSAWFTWQTFRFQEKIHSPQLYRDYLLGKDATKLKKKNGSRIYDAFLALRQLGYVENFETLKQVKHLLHNIDEESSETAANQLNESRKKDINNDDKTRYHLSLFLSQLWLGEVIKRKDHRRSIILKVTKNQKKLGLRRYGKTYSVLQKVDADDIHSGFISEIYRQSGEENINKDLLTGDNDLIDEPIEPSAEPEVLLFLSEGNDLLRGFYASKSALHHIESGNAGLLWPRWRLSKSAIFQVLSLIKSIPSDSKIHHRAKLAIGLSLLSGRSLSEVSVPVFFKSDDTSKLAEKIGINTSSMVLIVPAGTPELKSFIPTDDPLPKFCSPWEKQIRLPLPEFMHDLVDKVAKYNTTIKPETITRTAIEILDLIDKHYEVTPKSIQNALKLTLQEKSKGDLAFIKTITNASGLNYDNLIHYASFNREKLEEKWRTCIETWGIQIPIQNLPSTSEHGERVGSPFGIETDKVAIAIKEIKFQFGLAIKSQNWGDILNLLTLYTVLWLNLATAGRRVRNPFPTYISQNGWALIRDKHRKDESTDRYLPLTDWVRKQIEVLRSLMASLGRNQNDFFDAIEHCSYLINPKTYREDNKINDFAPSIMSTLEFISDLPGNWGRKLVRSEQNSLSGRFKDAGLGHWVRGRHPWTHTCSFPAALFKQEWLAMQNKLEQDLGFELLDISELNKLQSPNYCLPKKIKDEDSNVIKSYSPEQIIEWLSKPKYRDYKKVTLESKAPSNPVVLELGREFLGDLAKDKSIDLRAAAECYCALMRQKKNIPIYAQAPRSQFQKNWMVSQYAFSSWCYIEQQLLEKIKKDLSKLPNVETEPSIEIAIGRLLVAASLYGGIHRSSHLGSLMAFLSSDRPIHAVGDARAIELLVRCDRSKERIRRTLLLTPYLSSLLLVERERVKATLKNAQWNKCFSSYLAFLELPNQLSISLWLEALRQNLMLTASPLLAAYSAGEVLSEDLPISELQRLGGYLVSKPSEYLLVDEDTGSENGLMVEDKILPEIIKQIRTLHGRKESNFTEWEAIFLINKKDQENINGEIILKLFGKHLLDSFCTSNGSKNSLSIPPRMQLFFEERLTIVATGLIGFSDSSVIGFKFDEGSLQHLSELTEGYFPARKHQGAWNSFRKFLIEFKNLTIGRILEAKESRVSAKVFSTSEISEIIKQLDSTSSGLGNPYVRKIAQRHFYLTAGTGARRAEAENIRNLDVDDNMLRIRPYDGHTLKTAGSERALPIGILESSIHNDFLEIKGDKNNKVIDLDNEYSTDGNNFFHKVSQLITKVTGDTDLGMHHLRHTLASSYSLKTLGNTVDLLLLDIDLPWVKDWLPTDQQFCVLLGPEDQCGQGIKVTSAMLGHIHETTTLKHYIHTLFAALYANYLAQEQPALHTAFENRVMSRTSLFRHLQEINEKFCAHEQRVREMRNRIEKYLEKKTKNFNIVYSQKTNRNHQQTEGHGVSESAEQRLAQFDNIEKIFLTEVGEAPSDVEQWIKALEKLAAIQSGKKGCDKPRHPLPQVGKNRNLPKSLGAGTAYEHAIELLTWLLKLQENNPENYQWLIRKWLYYSEAEKGFMRLEPEEKKLVEDLSTQASIHGNIRLQISQIGKGYHFRIRISGDNGNTNREAGAVRWVMSWVSIEMLKRYIDPN